MKQTKTRILIFLLWYIPFFISATGDKYFYLLSCMLINEIGMSYPNVAVFLLWVIPAIFFSSFAFQRLHKYICILLFADGVLGYYFSFAITDHGKFDMDGYRAYFWMPFFDALGLNMKENDLFSWGDSASKAIPLFIMTIYTVFPTTTPKDNSNDEGKIAPFKQQVRDAWRKHKAVIPGLCVVIFIIYFCYGKSIYEGVKWAAERPEQMKQEFSHHLDAAGNGNVYSMTRVGGLYWRGAGTEYNTAEALRWLGKAAQNGSADAMTWLGNIYYSGYRTGRDWDKARYWLNAAIETDPEKAENARKVLGHIDKGLLPHQR